MQQKYLTSLLLVTSLTGNGVWAFDDCPNANYNWKGEWHNPIQPNLPLNEFQLTFDTLDSGEYGCYWVRNLNGFQDTQPGEVFLAFVAGETEDNVQILVAAADGHDTTPDGRPSIRRDAFIYAVRLSKSGLTNDAFQDAGIGLRSRGRPRSNKGAD